ncbi:hypothetical protein ATANTOWER_021806 [Ataeniobius toweri]|uniref:Uncharacterized protein n=1 Tax=Ataeniobius toweri TaxID=208326 RepID=A0ABU7AM46_9TELE|nr:hypothetical protein [Ataeniobius toweri]
MNCCLYIRYSIMNRVIKVQAWLDFLSEVYRSKLCYREFPAETLSLQRRVEQFSRSQGRTTGLHHRGYSCNVQFRRPTERAAPPHGYGGKLHLTLYSLWMFSSNFVALDNFSAWFT